MAPRTSSKISLSALAAWLILVALCIAAGCGGPKYPSCENDSHCNTEGHTGVCLNGTCVQCRDDAACGAGKKCQSGQCTSSGPVASNAPFVTRECSDDKPCPTGQRCENGHCVAPPKGGPGCTDFPAPKFDFESPALRPASKEVLQRLAGCLTTGTLKGSRVLLTGHCDNKGEYEFNMGLGAERAEGVKNFLTSAGVPADRLATSSRGKLDAVGTDEAGWENDRRVDIEIR